MSQLDHILNFGAGDKLVFDGDPAGNSANTVFHGDDATIINYATAYAYAYGDSTHAAAISRAAAYAVVSDSAGHVYVFAQDHAALEIDGLASGVNGVTVGQILAA
jgi:hypothetical protein